MARVTERKRRFRNLGPRPRQFWSRQLVIECILALHRNGITPNQKNLKQRNRDPILLRILESIVGVQTTPQGLLGAGTKHFGRWDHAIVASGLDRRRVRADIIWHPELVICAVQALHQQKVSVALADLKRDRSRKTNDILKKAVGFRTTAAKLVGRAHFLMGSWSAVLHKAGINPSTVTLRYWSKDTTIRAIQALHTAGNNLSCSKITHSRSKALHSTLYQVTQRKTNGRCLQYAALKHFGSWDNALSAAGINPKTYHRGGKAWSRELIVEVIQAYRKAGLYLSCSALTVENSKKARMTIRSITGRDILPVSLYEAGRRYFGSWPNALKAAGIDPKSIESKRYSSLATTAHQGEWTHCSDGIWRKSVFYGEPPKSAEAWCEENELRHKIAKAIQSLPSEMIDDGVKLYEILTGCTIKRRHEPLYDFIAKKTKGRISKVRAKAICSHFASTLSDLRN